MITMITNLPPPSSPPVAELREARAENDRLQDRVSMLNALLDEAVVDTAYKCYDCKDLFAALHNSPHSLASTTVSSVRSQRNPRSLHSRSLLLSQLLPHRLKLESIWNSFVHWNASSPRKVFKRISPGRAGEGGSPRSPSARAPCTLPCNMPCPLRDHLPRDQSVLS